MWLSTCNRSSTWVKTMQPTKAAKKCPTHPIRGWKTVHHSYRGRLSVREEGVWFLQTLLLGSCPNSQAEPDFVHKVSQVVNQIERASVNTVEQVSHQIPQGIDTPPNRDDNTHCLEGAAHGLAHVTASYGTSFTHKDLIQDEAPPSQAANETNPRVEYARFTTVTKCQHSNGADQQTPEHTRTQVRLNRREDKVKLDHLQRYRDRPPC